MIWCKHRLQVSFFRLFRWDERGLFSIVGTSLCTTHTLHICFFFNNLNIYISQDGKTPLDISLCYGKDFKSYDLAKLLKLVPANREL